LKTEGGPRNGRALAPDLASVLPLGMSESEKALLKLVVKAVLEQDLIQDGDRILIAVSGGKDSTCLAYALSAIRKAVKRDYELKAVHISSDFCACCKKNALSTRLESWGIPFDDIFVPVIGRLKPGRKMNCYWCSTQRRTELLRYSCEGGFNKIALGHHLDDIIETYFMNAMNKGRLSTMPVKMAYVKYPLTLIRPLAYVEERQVIAFASEANIMKAACTCPYGINSARRDIRGRIAALTEGSSAVKRRLLEAFARGGEPLPGTSGYETPNADESLGENAEAPD